LISILILRSPEPSIRPLAIVSVADALSKKQFAVDDGDIESVAATSAPDIERKSTLRPTVEVLVTAVWADVAGER
jgi:hypothetical protein